MKPLLLMATIFLLLTGCSTRYTFNGLACPTDDQNQIVGDLRSCEVYDLDKIDEALKDPNCQECLEQKGYTIISEDVNASK